MIEHEFSVRVRYSETDVMGYLHHSNYARYYETSRWELFRNLGISYKSVEDAGYMLPVIGMEFKFVKSAMYDDMLTIKTALKSIEGPRLTFSYRMYNDQNELINKAEVQLAFVDKATRVACYPPDFFWDAVRQATPNEYCI